MTGTVTPGASHAAARCKRKYCVSTDMPPPRSGNGITRRRTRRRSPVHSTTGRRSRLRVLLWLSGRRGVAVRAESRAQHDGRSPAQTPEEGYHLSEDLADDAIRWLRNPPSAHARQTVLYVLGERSHPWTHHVHKEWWEKYRGRFDDGWDAYRERAFVRAKELGWIPDDAELTPPAPS